MAGATRYLPYYDDLLEALATPGCAFCLLQQRAAERYLDALLWESVNDPSLRREVSAARGFCRSHAWLLVRPGAALSAAILYKDVVLGASRALQAAASHRPSLWQRLRTRLRRPNMPEDPVVQALAAQRICPACTNAREIEQHLCATVETAIQRSDEFLLRYRSSSGLCLDHFSTLTAALQPSRLRQPLWEAQSAVWQRLDAELAEFIRKNDHRFRGEPFGVERDAWERAIALTSGPQPAATSTRGGLTQSR